MYVASWVVFHLVNIIGVVVKLIEFFFSSNITDQVHTINSSAHAAYFIYHLASFVISSSSSMFVSGETVVWLLVHYDAPWPIHH